MSIPVAPPPPPGARPSLPPPTQRSGRASNSSSALNAGLSTITEKLAGKLARITADKGTWFAGVVELPPSTDNPSPRSVSVSGPCFEVPPLDADVELAGAYVTDPKYGRQFKFTWCRHVPPSTREGVLSYLCTLPGIGPVRAEAIYAKFGDESIERLAADPSACLSQVKGLSTTKATEIAEDLTRRASSREVEKLLHSMGFGERTRQKIRDEFGPALLNILRDDPYQLVRVDRVSFHAVDTAVLALGVIPANSPKRAAAALCQSIKDHTEQGGHTWLMDSELFPALGKLNLSVSVPVDALISGRDHALKVEFIVAVSHPTLGIGYTTPAIAEAETCSAAKILGLLAHNPDPFGSIENVPADMREDLTDDQRRAVELATTSRVSILTGGPGTGKTYATRAIIAAFAASDEVAVLAPTGKAAKRASDVTGHRAHTIHRFVSNIKFAATSGDDDENPETPQKSTQPRVVIIDESSMVDVCVLWMLLSNLRRPDLRLIFVGDVDQLPSIGPGAVLADLLRSRIIPTTRLVKIQRQSADSRIIANAHAINRGDLPDHSASPRNDWFFMQGNVEGTDLPQLAKRVVESIDRAVARWGYNPRTDIQILSGQRKSALGVEALNVAIREHLNPSRPGEFEIVTRDGSQFRRRDKVICTANDYNLGVVNGDVGEIVDVLPARVGFDGTKLPQAVDVRLDGSDPEDPTSVVRFAGDAIWLLTQAWAMTVHKSQGSEYKMVVFIAHTCMSWALQRALLYTAITRGKERVAVIGTQKAMAMAVKKVDTSQRNTRLSYLLNPKLGKV